MERKAQDDSIEHIFEDHGGEEAIIGADDTGMVGAQRTVIANELESDAAEGGEDDLA